MKKVHVILTPLEAEALAFAAGNIIDACSWEEQKQFFTGKASEALAGQRALAKLWRAYHEAFY